MNVIVCIEDSFGMMFNNRRLSRDQILIEHVLNIVGNKQIWINSYSKILFPESNVKVSESFLDKCGEDEYCFVEDKRLLPYTDKIKQLYVFNWNRAYPSDQKFDLDLSKFELQETNEFVGYSHENITINKYTRR